MTPENEEGSVLRDSDTTRVLQLTDPHIFPDPAACFDGVNTLGSLKQVIALARRSHWPADAVVVTGDLVHDGSPAGYTLLRQCLISLAVPVYCMAGNHDDPGTMQAFLPGGNVHVTEGADLGRWRLVFVNTPVPGREGGHVGEDSLRRLESALHADGDKPVLVCLHHPPVSIGSPWMDAMGLDNPADLFAVLDRSGGVRGVIWGHIHQEFAAVRKGIPLWGTPSTCVQFTPRTDRYRKDSRTAGYRWLVLKPDGGIETGIQRLK